MTGARKGKGKVGDIRYEAQHLGFLSLRNAQTIDPSTAWTAVSLPQWKHRVLVFTHEWSGARPMGEQWLGLDPIGQTILKRYLLNHGARRQRRELFALFSQQNSLQNCSIAIRFEIVVQVSLPSPLDLLHPPHEHESTPGWEPLTYKLIGDLNNK